MKKAGKREQVEGLRLKAEEKINTVFSCFSFSLQPSALSLILLLTVYCSLFTALYGCASGKKSELPNAQSEAIAYNRTGVDAVEAGNYNRAFNAFQKALQLNAKIDNQKGVAISLLNLGRLHLLMEKFDDAKKAFDRVVKIGLNLDDQVVLSEGYASLGRYYYLTGGNNDAVGFLEKAEAIDRKEGYHTIGNRLVIMGMIYKDEGKREEALKILNDALKISKDYKKNADAADAYRGLGDIFREKGDYKKAEESYENALSIDKKLGISAKISTDLAAMGMTNLKQNNAGKALDFFIRAYEVDLSSGAYKKALKDVDAIITIYAESGDQKNADAYSLEREKLLKKEGTKDK